MIVRYFLHGALVLASLQISSLHCMKMTLATKLHCPDQATYQLVEAIKEDNAELVQEALRVVDPTTLVRISELYNMLEPRERTFSVSLLQLATSFLAKKSVALLLAHSVDVDFADVSVKGCLNHGTALMVLCRTLQPRDYEIGHDILKMLLVYRANPNQHDLIGTPLSYRARAGDIEGVQLLMAAKADPHVIVMAPRFGSGRVERHFLLRTLVHDIEDRKEKNEDPEGTAIRMGIVRTLLEEGALPCLISYEKIPGSKFQEQTPLVIVKDPLLRNLLRSYKLKIE